LSYNIKTKKTAIDEMIGTGVGLEVTKGALGVYLKKEN
jgi:hypothetical protein